MPVAVADYEFVRGTGLLDKLAAEGHLVGGSEVAASELGLEAAEAAYVLEHDRIPFISFPYEWSFPTLKAAALLHLDIQRRALEVDVSLSDASAYNIQFKGPRPVFIDALSFKRYEDGEFWTGHHQFCEQFLNPLLLRSILGVAHNAWYRGNQEGIATEDLARIIPFRKKFSWNVLSQVVLQSKLQSSVKGAGRKTVAKTVAKKQLPKAAYQGMLERLRSWIAQLEPADTGPTVWGDYAQQNSYEGEEAAAKRKFIHDFTEQTKPRQLWDIGCNTGDYSSAALDGGAMRVIGFDYDQAALERAFARAVSEKLDFLPLFLDAANQSPSQGWAGTERMGLAERRSADALVSLAFVHHMAIGRNIPLDHLVDWLTGFAPTGVIEFVPKQDPMVQELLGLREDIFPDYTEEAFVACIEKNARIVRRETVTKSRRTLFLYDSTR
jgi:ribosomal protein L11 methylase PrmA